jgi:hypothetical protein
MAKVALLIAYGEAFMGLDLWVTAFESLGQAEEAFRKTYDVTHREYVMVFEAIADEGASFLEDFDPDEVFDAMDHAVERETFDKVVKLLFADKEAMLCEPAGIFMFDPSDPQPRMVIGQSSFM